MATETNPVILHSFPVWLPQTQTWMYGQVAGLQALGIDARVACERTENLDQFRVDNIYCLANEGWLQETWDKSLRKLRLRRHLDFLTRTGNTTGARIVHSHFGNVAWANLGAVRRLGAKHVVTFYGVDVTKFPKRFPIWRRRYEQLFAEVDLVLCEGSHMAGRVVELGCPESKVKVHHLGVAVEQIRFVSRRWAAGDPLRVLIAASFREKKGIPYAIEALGMLSRATAIKLTIIGDAGPEPESQTEKHRILRALDRTGLRSSARLLGYQPHAMLLKEAYEHHIFLQPSVTALDGDTEGGAPVTITELMATGMPVVGTVHCDIPEVFGRELSQLLASERNAEDLSRVINLLLSAPERWKEWATTARTRIETEYNILRQSKRLVSHYWCALSDDAT